MVAVGPERDAEPVRSFRSFMKELHELADWLKQVGISTVGGPPRGSTTRLRLLPILPRSVGFGPVCAPGGWPPLRRRCWLDSSRFGRVRVGA
ncbi:hypothetical protein BN2475_670029 [Paraburkholderia ribeironis]|uniref:Uncharacterized protein n=1 Tax=Paraburkholderia ribeironis TaxID=1247936 RepID=A0A1N7SGP3_9BURK|nr:hypothetical protein BN2475_670029 [Paraburkholderia ribeironis]